jgi:hypothetical protein
LKAFEPNNHLLGWVENLLDIHRQLSASVQMRESLPRHINACPQKMNGRKSTDPVRMTPFPFQQIHLV